MKGTLPLFQTPDRTPRITEELTTKPPIFGLRYLEEEDTDIYDVVGCLRAIDPGDGAGSSWQSGCDVDYD